MDPTSLQAKEAKESRAALGAGRRSKSSGNSSGNKKQDAGKLILRDAAKVDFKNEADAQAWNSKHKERLLRKNCNILLLLASDESVVKRWKEPERRRAFLRWVLGMHHHLLEVTAQFQRTPLHMALYEGNSEFVEVVLEHDRLVNIRNVLPLSCHAGNALHVALKSPYRSEMIELIELLIKKCAEIKDMFVAGNREDGNCPLHICMSLDIQDDNGDDESDVGTDESGDDEDDRDTEDGFMVSSPASRRRMGVIDGDGPADMKSPVAATQGPYGGDLKRRTTFIMDAFLKQRRDEMLKVVRLLIKANRAALLQKNEGGRTPYQERIHQLRAMEIHQRSDEETMQRVITEDPVTDFIRSYCIRNMPRDEIIKCLYQPGQGMAPPVFPYSYGVNRAQ